MSVLYDENFQSYSPGQNPPYAQFANGPFIATPSIDATTGVYGDPQCLNVPVNSGVIYPILPNITLAQALAGVTYTSLGVPFYTACSISFAIYQSENVDQQGVIISLLSLLHPFAGVSIAAIRIMTDGSIGIVAPNSSAFKKNDATSDFAFHTNQWYWLQVNFTFGTSGSFMTADITVAVNGFPVVSFSGVTTRTIAGLPVEFWNALQIAGAGFGIHIGRVTIYDVAQTVPSYQHPGSPVARVNQGLIELIKSITGGGGAACPLSTATVGEFYSSDIGTPATGTPPFTYALTGGSFPPGLSLDPSTGTVSGTPTSAVFDAFTITITDSAGTPQVIVLNCGITAQPPPFPPPFCIAPLVPTIASTTVAYTEPTEPQGT